MGTRIHPAIYAVGTGMVGLRQLTPEAETALSGCRRIYTLHFDSRVVAQLATRYINVESLDRYYAEGKPRRDTYEQVASTILTAAQEEPPVAFVTYGHPWVFVRPTTLLTERAPELGLEVEVLPGVSAFDTLFVDLGFDPGESGLQAYEATDVLLRNRPISPDVPCLIWQIGATGTLTYESQMTDQSAIAKLITHLHQFYPEDHPVTVARSASTPLGTKTLTTLPMNELAGTAPTLRAADTLYIPPTLGGHS